MKKSIYYLLSALLLFLRALCGYEYLSTILISMMVFPFVKLILTFRNRHKFIRELKTITWISIFALVGCILAMLLHSFALGEGDIVEGLKKLYIISSYRASWADADSINAVFHGNQAIIDNLNFWKEMSMFSVVGKYLDFPTSIILGLPGKLFIPLALGALIVVGLTCVVKKQILPELIMLTLFFLASISWLFLAKMHANHLHLNYILWYFGFVQTTLYILIRTVINMLSLIRKMKIKRC
ncbi:MAG: hypothetical protein ACK5JF_08690 [Oscillospiraceae bacterium]